MVDENLNVIQSCHIELVEMKAKNLIYKKTPKLFSWEF